MDISLAWKGIEPTTCNDCTPEQTPEKEEPVRQLRKASWCAQWIPGDVLGSAMVVSIALLVSHPPHSDHSILFYCCDTLLALAFLGYAGLRCVRSVDADTLAPMTASFVWLLCLLISLSAPSQRRRLLGQQAANDTEPCEEGNAVMWIALLLVICAVCAPIPWRIFALLGQLVALQHLAMGLLLPRPECSVEHFTYRGSSGASSSLLGIPQLWVSALQLHAIAAILTVLQRRLDVDRQIAHFAEKFVQDSAQRRVATSSLMEEEYSHGALIRTLRERMVDEFEHEEEKFREFLKQVCDMQGSKNHEKWMHVVYALIDVVSWGTEQLTSKDSKFMDNVTQAGAEMEAGSAALPCWVTQAWTTAGGMNGLRTPSMNGFSLKASPTSASGRDRCGNSPSNSSRSGALDNFDLSPSIELCDEDWINVGDWNFDAVRVQTECERVLQIVGFDLLRVYSFLPKVPLQHFLEVLEEGYIPTNPYHSNAHAADMCNSFWFLVTKSGLRESAALPESNCAAMIIAGLGHDVGHFARGNPFLISARHALAVTYNDRSVMESFHASTIVRLLDERYGEEDEGRGKVQLFSALPSSQLSELRKLITTLILATDTQKHLEDLAAFRLRLGTESFDPRTEAGDLQQTLSLLFRAADIGHSAKRWDLHQEWSTRVVQEFHEQGDEERRLKLPVSPLCDRTGFDMAKSQSGFLKFICLPTWQELARFELLLLSKGKEERLPPMSKTYSGKVSSKPEASGQDILNASKRRNSELCSVPSLALGKVMPGELSPLPDGAAAAKRRASCAEYSLNQRSSNNTNGNTGVNPVPEEECYCSTEKVTSAATGGRSRSNQAETTHWIAEVCLAQCEENFRIWEETSQQTEPAHTEH